MTDTQRRYVALSTVVNYWANADETITVLPDLKAHGIGWFEPFCFACGWLAPVVSGPRAWHTRLVTGWFECAHLVDHWLGGPSDPANLVPLCHLCHDQMPSFTDRAAALAWVTAFPGVMPQPDMWQQWTNGYGEAHRSAGGNHRSTILRLRGDFFAALLQLSTTAPTPSPATSQRTAAAIAARRADGATIGRRSVLPLAVVRRIQRDSVDGLGMNEIARRLNAEGVPSALGGVWYASTVRAAMRSQQAASNTFVPFDDDEPDDRHAL